MSPPAARLAPEVSWGPILEWVGFVRSWSDYDRVARGIAKYVALYFAISSGLAYLFIPVLLTAWLEPSGPHSC